MIIGQLLYAVLWIIITLIAITPILMLAKRAGAGGLIGIYVGTIIALSIMISNWLGFPIPIKPFGIHAGLWGLTFNCLVIFCIYRNEHNTNIKLA